VSAARTTGRLLRLYPAAWRERYGAELETLVLETSGAGRVPWRIRADVAVAGVRERLRPLGPTGSAPADQARDGALLVLVAWALFVAGGCGVQRFSEHWAAATPAASRSLPAHAFTTLVGTAVVGGLLVVAGGVLALPGLRAFVREGGWITIRRPVVVAGAITIAGVAATGGLAQWGRTVTEADRSAHELLFGAVYLSWAALAATGIVAWAVVAAMTARRLRWPPAVLRVEAALAVLLTVAMVVMTTATAIWWVGLARSASWFLADQPVGHEGSPFAPLLALPYVAMTAATALAVAGSRRAATGAAGLSRQA
jgi:hypothetical protein